jgi:hypothetical protein
MSETPQEYLSRIGAVGGAKSRRKLSKKEARRIAKVRWAAAESAQPPLESETRVRLQRAGSETDEELLSDAALAMTEWWNKCWQTSPCMCAALRPTDFFKFGYLAGRRAHAAKSQNARSATE